MENRLETHESKSIIGDNQYFAAGLGLFGVGTGLALLRHSLIKGLSLLTTHCVTSLEITSKDPAYQWVLSWVGKNCKSFSKTFTLNTMCRGNGLVTCDLTPSPGTHFIQWNRRYIRFTRTRQTSVMDLSTGQPFENLTLCCAGRNQLRFLARMVEEAKQEAMRESKDKLAIFTSFANEWRLFGNPAKTRPLDSVILQDGICQRIINDITEFLASSEWYHHRGIPFRRGYLLYGPPGTGKTSFIHALASHLNMSISIMNFGQTAIGADRISHLFNNLPERTILLLEDVDRISDAMQTKSSPSALLNALDGVAASEGRIIFMTTNFVEKLDAALVRPGRIDVKYYIGNANGKQAERMFLRFFPTEQETAQSFRQLVDGSQKEISPATIQAHLIMHKNNAVDALQSLKTELTINQKQLM